MKGNRIYLIVSLTLLLVISSCVTNKKLTYLQYYTTTENPNQEGQDNITLVTPADYRVLPYDNLFIRVITPDPQWSELFNTTAAGQGGALTEESAGLLGYPVGSDGNIEIPFVGKIHVVNKTLTEIKSDLDSIFKKYLNDAAITVRLVNNYISILGEVRAPGRYPLTKDRVNIFEILSQAGDLNEYTNRQKIKLIRQSQYGPIVKEFSLLDRDILTSEYFYLMPNDIIYAQPMHGRTFSTNSSVYQVLLGSLTTILSAITTLMVIFNINNGNL
jgi:polysaccharide biosynthesis/export protein